MIPDLCLRKNACLWSTIYIFLFLFYLAKDYLILKTQFWTMTTVKGKKIWQKRRDYSVNKEDLWSVFTSVSVLLHDMAK